MRWCVAAAEGIGGIPFFRFLAAVFGILRRVFLAEAALVCGDSVVLVPG